MFRRLFQVSPIPLASVPRDAPAEIAVEQSLQLPSPEGAGVTKPPAPVELGKFDSFDQIYRSGPANHAPLPYDILKVAQMLESPHISGMSVESKRGSLMMALEAAHVAAEDILQDALIRQRAISDYDELQQRSLRDFESLKSEENRVLQEELDQLNSQYLARIQANISQVAKHQDALRAWQKVKHSQLAAMAEACSYLAPLETSGNSLAAALNRAARR